MAELPFAGRRGLVPEEPALKRNADTNVGDAHTMVGRRVEEDAAWSKLC